MIKPIEGIQQILDRKITVLVEPVYPQPEEEIFFDGDCRWHPIGPYGGEDWFCPFGTPNDPAIPVDYEDLYFSIQRIYVKKLQDLKNLFTALGFESEKEFHDYFHEDLGIWDDNPWMWVVWFDLAQTVKGLE